MSAYYLCWTFVYFPLLFFPLPVFVLHFDMITRQFLVMDSAAPVESVGAQGGRVILFLGGFIASHFCIYVPTLVVRIPASLPWFSADKESLASCMSEPL